MHLPDYNPDLFSVSGMINFIVGILTFLLCFICFITLPFSAILTTRRFDPILRNKTICFFSLGRLMRGTWYAFVMTLPWLIRKGGVVDRAFRDCDLWGNATRSERIVACIHIYSGLLSVLGMLTYPIMYVIYLFQISYL